MQSARSISIYRLQESVVHAAPDTNCVTMQNGAEAINYLKKLTKANESLLTF